MHPTVERLSVGIEKLSAAGDGQRYMLNDRLLTQAKIELSNRSEVSPMAVRQPRYSKEEFPQRGDALYETEIRSQVEEGNHGKIVAIR